MRLNFKLILYIIGLLLIFNSSAMILTAIVSLIFNDGVVNEIITSAAILMSLGLILMLTNKNNIMQINKRDGYLIVTVGWLTMILSGMMPYYMTNSIDSFSNIFFETMLKIQSNTLKAYILAQCPPKLIDNSNSV